MELKIFYTGPLLIRTSSKQEAPISEIELSDLKFEVEILNQKFECKLRPIELGGIPLTWEEDRYYDLDDVLNKHYSNFLGNYKLLKEFALYNLDEYYFLGMIHGREKLLTGQQILHLLSLD